MAVDPDDLRAKAQRGAFERKEEEELEEEEEVDVDLGIAGVANTEMEQSAEAARIKMGARKLSAEALAEMTQPWGVSRYVSGGDDDESGSPRRARGEVPDDDEPDAPGSLDAPLWHGIAAAPPPPPRPAGFPPGSKWVRPT